MSYKSRTKSLELQILHLLNNRMQLSDKDKQHYFNLNKGFEGEVTFDLLTEKLECECFIINDLLIKVNQTTVQIDSIIITSETIFVFEIKNFEGDFYYESDRLYKKNKSEINNPLIQLKRSESLLRQLLHNLGFNLPIVASVIFINPEFTLYQTPLNIPFIFPTQVNQCFKKLNSIPSRLNRNHKLLAEKLTSLHIDDSPFTQLPSYDYEQLQKGITCELCNSFSVYIEGMKVNCKQCGHHEILANAVMRSVNEFKLLFPNKKITTNAMYEWCKIVNSKKRIKRVLDKHFEIVGVHQWSFYKEK